MFVRLFSCPPSPVGFVCLNCLTRAYLRSSVSIFAHNTLPMCQVSSCFVTFRLVSFLSSPRRLTAQLMSCFHHYSGLPATYYLVYDQLWWILSIGYYKYAWVTSHSREYRCLSWVLKCGWKVNKRFYVVEPIDEKEECRPFFLVNLSLIRRSK